MPTECDACETLKLRVEYLTRQYGFYTGHMNQVFNFYLVSTTLIVGAFVESLSGAPPIVPEAIALVGMSMSVVFGLLHWRSFIIAGLLDVELEKVEKTLDVSFMDERRKSQSLLRFARSALPKFLYDFLSWLARLAKPVSTPVIYVFKQVLPPWLFKALTFRNSTVFPLVYAGFALAFAFAACNIGLLRSLPT